MSARKPKRTAKVRKTKEHPATLSPAQIQNSRESLQKCCNGLLDLQMRIWAARSQLRCIHALAEREIDGSDIEFALSVMADELNSIANKMGDFLPLGLSEVQS